MVAWPGTLPSIPNAITDIPGDGRIRTGMDVGPPKLRLRTTADVRRIPPFDLIITGTQRTTLETFYVTTLTRGVFGFDWEDPHSGSTIEYRFANRPEYRLLMPHDTDNSRIWAARIELENLP